MGIKSKLRSTFVYTLYKRFGLERFFSPDGWQTTKRRIRDRIVVPLRHPSLLPLHRRLRGHLKSQKREWPHLKYSFGYFYQGWDRIKVSGARSTESRFESYDFAELLKEGMTVLDVGCNVGFLAMAVAERVKHLDAVELNPYLVAIGKDVSTFLGIENVSFHQMDFLEFKSSGKYDLIMSFANHKTIDGNMDPDLRDYFLRLYDMLEDDGVLLFETHQYDNDSPEFHACVDSLSELFPIRRKQDIPATKDDVRRIFYVFDKKLMQE